MHTVGRHTTAHQESKAPPFPRTPRPSRRPTATHNASPLEDNMGEAEPVVLTSPTRPPPPSSSESDLEVNLEDDPNHETASEEEPEPLLVEEVVFNSLEMARKEEEDRHLRAITQKETNDCNLKRVIEISKEEERRREEEEKCRHEEEERRCQDETERRLAMDAERRRRRAERKKREEDRQQGDDACGSTGSN
ncbi:vicilin-like seed storage protein At2g18540 [Miscanthus floridulus]|uniref:vicilin-like seed storage protein At2g18540 n=1 Tax=Miscanthus floridulus TaxID=154761 RepID=UPI003457F593